MKKYWYGAGILGVLLVLATSTVITIEDQTLIQRETQPVAVTKSIPENKEPVETVKAQQPIVTPDVSISVTLIADEKSYTVRLPHSQTVFEAMNALASTSSFTFHAKYYSGLGYFIDSVNGKKNDEGAYWTLYINDEYSQKGASQAVVGNGDVITWKYEKR